MSTGPGKGKWLLLALVAGSAWFFLTEEPRGTVEIWLAERGISFSTPSIEPGFEVFDLTPVPPDRGRSLLRGTFRNNTDRRFRVVQLEFDLLDASGAVVGGAVKFMSEITPGQTRAFEADASGTSFSDARLVKAQGW